MSSFLNARISKSSVPQISSAWPSSSTSQKARALTLSPEWISGDPIAPSMSCLYTSCLHVHSFVFAYLSSSPSALFIYFRPQRRYSVDTWSPRACPELPTKLHSAISLKSCEVLIPVSGMTCFEAVYKL